MLEVKRIRDAGNRPASQLTNDLVRAVIDDMGGMIPELSFKREQGYLNTHWIPYFRSNSGAPFDPKLHGEFWGGSLLYEAAGNFPCLPSFGMPGEAYGVRFEPHGTTPHNSWKLEKSGVVEGQAAYAVTSLEGREPADISYRKYDFLLPGHPVHYSVLKVRNSGGSPYRINAAWHNTIAAPFLETGCLIDLSADRFATPPSPSEFDDTGRLSLASEFDDLRKAPLRSGGSLDARLVPGMVGFTDFITGAVPDDASIGWSSIVNPALGAIYLCFFKGPAAAREDDIALSFNDLWLQYGGRRFTPWAFTSGGTDQIFCLGSENAVGAFAHGLEYSLSHPTLLGRPTTVEIPARGERTLYYGTLAARFEGETLRGGVSRVEGAAGKLVVVAKSGAASQSFTGDPDFASVARLVDRLG